MKRLNDFLDKPEGEKVTLVKKSPAECIFTSFNQEILEQCGEW